MIFEFPTIHELVIWIQDEYYSEPNAEDSAILSALKLLQEANPEHLKSMRVEQDLQQLIESIRSQPQDSSTYSLSQLSLEELRKVIRDE